MSLLERMLKEEWRMHSTLFGGLKFALFPFVIFVISLLIFFTFPIFGFGMQEIQLIMVWITFFMGLNIGTIGFVTQGGMKNLLGEMNLLIFSSRTLPVSEKRILSNFLLKDFLYYLFFLIIPMVFGNLVLNSWETVIIPVFISYFLSFVLGVSITFFFSVFYRIVNKTIFSVFVLVFAGALFLTGEGVKALPPYQFLITLSLNPLFITLLTVAALLILGITFFNSESYNAPEIRKNLFERFSNKFGALNSKNIIDIKRSTGGFGKIIFTFLVLFLFVWFLLAKLPLRTLFMKNPLMTFAVLLGITPVSIYSWLNRFDSLGEYEHLPLSKKEILKGKLFTYFYIGPVLLLAADLGAFLLFDSSLLVLIHALLISFSSSIYLLSVVVYLTGLEPNTRLFNAAVFTKFILASLLVLIPFLMIPMFLYPASFALNSSLILLYIFSALSSYFLLRNIVNPDFEKQ